MAVVTIDVDTILLAAALFALVSGIKPSNRLTVAMIWMAYLLSKALGWLS